MNCSRSNRLLIVAAICATTGLGGCSAPPDLTGFAVNTPKTYSENKVFFTRTPVCGDLPAGVDATEVRVFEHLYEVHDQLRTLDDDTAPLERIIWHNDPLSVVLQGVRIPEDIGAGTRDIAVVLDLHTSTERGVTEMVAFYQRDVPPGQLLNFNNLLVYADPSWDSANPPYFRVRVLDVKAERNRRTAQVLSEVSNLSAEIGGMVPHPVIPVVTSAIDAAKLVLSNQQNKMLLDYQIQFYGTNHLRQSGDATLGALRTGEWLVVGRERGQSSEFWGTEMWVSRKTNRIYRATESGGSRRSPGDPTFEDISVPYVAITIIKADSEVPKLVMDRSEQMIKLLSTPAGKSDVDGLTAALGNLTSATNMYARERRLRKYRSVADLHGIINQLKAHDENESPLNTNELRRLMYVLKSVTEVDQATSVDWATWWEMRPNQDNWYFKEDPNRPFGIVFVQREQ